MTTRTVTSLIVIALLGFAFSAAAQDKKVSASAAWVAAPAPGATSAMAYLEIENPTMYDVYVVSASSDASTSVELHQADAGGQSKATKEIAVPAFGAIALTPGGLYLELKGLTRKLAKGDTVALTLETDGGDTLKVAASVR